MSCSPSLPRFAARAEDEEYDMIAYAYNRWIKFNSNDPTQWETYANTDSSFGSDRLSAAAMLNGRIYASNYNRNAGEWPHYLGILDDEMEPTSGYWLSIPKLGIPVDVGGGALWNFPLITAMSSCEADGHLYALAAYYDHIETEDTVWMIARVDENSGELDPVCSWYSEQWHSITNPISFAALNDGTFAVIEARSNSLIIVDPADPYNFTTVCELPVMASNVPLGMYVYPPMPQSMYYDSESNTVLWGAAKQYFMEQASSYLVKIDLSSGEIIYCEDIRGAGKPMGWMLWPLNCFMKLPEQTLIPGDADGSGSVEVSDAVLALRCAMGLIETVPVFENADMDGSGALTVSDAVWILRLAMGLE